MEPSVSTAQVEAPTSAAPTEALVESLSPLPISVVPEFTPISPATAPEAPVCSIDAVPQLEQTMSTSPAAGAGPNSADALILPDHATTIDPAGPVLAPSSATQTAPSTPTETTEASPYLPSITPGATLPGGLDVLFREIPDGCRQLLTLTDISESANFRGYFTVCELLALKQVLLRRYSADMNGGVPKIESPPAAAEEQPECEPSSEDTTRKPKLKRSNANSAAGGSKRRSSWSCGGNIQAGASTSKQVNGNNGFTTTQALPLPLPEIAKIRSGNVGMAVAGSSTSGSSAQIQLSSMSSLSSSAGAGTLQSVAPSSSSPYVFCSLGCCTLPAPSANSYYSNVNAQAVAPVAVGGVGNACEGMGSVVSASTDMEMEPKVEPELLQSQMLMHTQRQPLNGNGQGQGMYYGAEGQQPSTATIHYTVHGTSVCPPPSNAGRPYQCPPYIPYLENLGAQSQAQPQAQSEGQGDVCGLGSGSRSHHSRGQSQGQDQYQKQQQQPVRSIGSIVPGLGFGPGPVPSGSASTSAPPREIRHGLPPPPPYRSLALVTRLLKIGNYYFRSFSEVNPNRCKVLFNTQHLLYECHLPIVQPTREFQPLRKLLTIDVKFEQITHMQFDTDKLFIRVDGAPGLTITYNPVTPEDTTVPPLSPDDQCLLNNIENGQLTLSPCHELYFLNERLVQNLRSHFREMPQFSRFFYYEQSMAVVPIQVPGPCRASNMMANGSCGVPSCPYSWNPQPQQAQPQPQPQQHQAQQQQPQEQQQQQQLQRQI